MRWLDSIIYSMNMNLRKFQDIWRKKNSSHLQPAQHTNLYSLGRQDFKRKQHAPCPQELLLPLMVKLIQNHMLQMFRQILYGFQKSFKK